MSGPRWPYGEMEFIVRLFADGGRTVVEQPIGWTDVGGARVVLVHDAKGTTENGQPVEVSYAFFDGEVTASAADPWEVSGVSGALTLGDQGEATVILLGIRSRSLRAASAARRPMMPLRWRQASWPIPTSR